MDNIAKKGDVVRVHYVGTFESGEEFDSSAYMPPLEFELGAGKMIPGFDRAVQGMKVGETKTVKLPPEEAYGISGPNPLAGKTLIFKITLVGINAA